MADEAHVVKTTETKTAQTTYPSGAHETVVRPAPEQSPSLLSNILAIVGFIIVVVIVLWGLFHIANLGLPWLSSLFGNRSSSIQVSAPANVTSDTAFAVTWKYSTSEKGTYAFLYQCKDTVRLETTDARGLVNTVPCGAAFTVATTNNSLMLMPKLSGTATTSVPLTVIFMPSATSSEQVQGSATVSVSPRAGAPIVVRPPATTTPPTPRPTPTPVTPQPRPTGPADLSVQIISVDSDGAGGGIAVFEISNVGRSSTGTYHFTAQLPTHDGYLYSSPLQSSLAPGDRMLNTLRFSQAVSGLFSVVVDPANARYESNTTNNYASRQVSMPYNNYNQYQPYQNYNPYPIVY
ncbi:hypothetical protein A3C18_03595 [Candidatus Kaiserbacteria bacterium RIFCSPHIGHO2_02_FULL_54_11b]|uniref:CARDB domain-containing protein n=1 Tax=Candidatus Kaiserbacteria bacterium RIFCSPHIGHO2_02_FULL_54_11b TaxID=1798494 RepID=A0A1F6DSD4_9BACT|nr:MAG: hypothetical protein A3C18_03595 [Candidatus Kaiserbacteria bacterium RIFCSPHIGHO2_02_FULL_54_11b]